MRLTTAMLALALSLPLAASCGDGDDIDSDTEARWAYLGFDRAIDRGISLGFAGYNAASSANIPAQTGDGDETGTMTVSGKVDQGASDNKEMDLTLTLVDYHDGAVDDPLSDAVIEVTYDTDDTALPLLDLSLRNVPNGTFTGSLLGEFIISGDVEGRASFAIALSGSLQEDPENAGEVIREPGTMTITGTVTSGDGTYDVDFTR